MKQKKLLIVLFVLAVAVFGAVYLILQQQPAPVTVSPDAKKISSDELAALQAKAEAGDPAAQTSLGKIYLEGSSVKTDVKQAVKWFQLAAKKNFPDALAMMGELAQAGQGVPPDPEAAVGYYRRAAEAGNVAGQYNLAYLYERGTGVKQDEHEAAKWYLLAAECGDPIAQYDIGQRYEIGVGVATNHVEAFKWLTLAAAQGQSDSEKMLPAVRQEMSNDELSQAKQLVQHFTPRPAIRSGTSTVPN